VDEGAVNIDLINMDWLTTDQAAARLAVKRETLYAYVSRGLLSSRRGKDGRSRFAREEILRLASRRGASRSARVDIAVESAISVEDAGRLYYRGHDVHAHCASRAFEDIAELLWTGTLAKRHPWPAPSVEPRGGDRAFLDQVRLALPHLPDGRDVATARQLMVGLVSCLPKVNVNTEDGPSFAARVWSRLSPRRPTKEQLDRLNRILGWNAERGIWGATLPVRVLAAHGAGLRTLLSSGMETEQVALDGSGVEDLAPAGGLMPEAAEIVNVVARAAGWMAHAMEEYSRPTDFRVRTVYTGPEPQNSEESRPLLHAVQEYLREGSQ
jgi:citrate synthase